MWWRVCGPGPSHRAGASGTDRAYGPRAPAEAPELAGVAPQLRSLSAEMNQDGNRILLPLLGAAGLVLLIACGNVAALLLVRGLQRQQEYAVRSALGMRRVELFRQVSTENLLLALLGGTVGVGIAFGVVKLFKVIGGHAIPRLDAVNAGWPVLLFGLVSAILAAVIAGLFPAFRASRLDPIHVLKGAGRKAARARGERRLLRAVTMAQTALTLALLVGAGLLIRTMMNLANVQSGFDTRLHPDHECHGRAGTMGRLSSARSGTGIRDSRRRAGRLRMGRSPDRQQLAGRDRDRRSAGAASESDRIAIPLRSATKATSSCCACPSWKAATSAPAMTAKARPSQW